MSGVTIKIPKAFFTGIKNNSKIFMKPQETQDKQQIKQQDKHR